MRLYNYFRSSASFRVRIALALKQLPYDYQVVHLQKGEQHQGEFAAHSADHLVPMLQLDDGTHVLQSLAICEYLDETHPTPPLLPADPMGRARVRALAQMVACGARCAATQVIGPHPHPRSRMTSSVAVSGGASKSSSLVPASRCSAEKTPRSAVSVMATSGRAISTGRGSDSTAGSSSKYWPVLTRATVAGRGWLA